MPADAALASASGLAVNESILTGESEAVAKRSGDPADTGNDLHKPNIVYAGTAVLRGSAEGIVIATGTYTQMGKISVMLQDVRQDMTPLQKRLAGLGKAVALLCLGVCAAVFLAGILRGEPVFDMLMTGITIAIAAIPEGLPATVTIALALAVSRMMKHGALVNRLHSVETLGCASVICSDKTGTITENRMTVTAISAGGESFQVTGTGLHIAGAFLQDGRMVNPSAKQPCGSYWSAVLFAAQRNCIGRPRRSPSATAASGRSVAAGTLWATPRRLPCWWQRKRRASHGKALRQHPVRHMEPFDSETRRMAVTVSAGAGVCTYWKGAADCILEQCGFQMLGDKTVPLTAAQKRSIREQAAQFSDQALRVLALARQDGTGTACSGACCMIDPPRESARTAIRTCARAKIRTVMITGDHKNTASAIARQAGLLRGKKAMTGAELDASAMPSWTPVWISTPSLHG